MSATLQFFDCNCMIGKRADRRVGEPSTVEQLLVDMKVCGITEALVIHASSKDYDPHSGNKAVLAAVAGKAGLHPCWAILPPETDELPPPDAFVREMLSNNVKAAVAYPVAHSFSLSSWSLEPLLLALEQARIPLLLPFGQFAWDEVERLCKQHVYLPLILTGLNYRQLRYLLPLWEKHRNLFVDLSWFSIHDGLSYLSGRSYIRQILFGTNYPQYMPGAAVTVVTYARIPEVEKQMVAGGTLKDIIQRIRRTKR